MASGRGMARLILASASPRRIELLGSLGLIFDIVPSSADEYVDGRPDPGLLVETLAKRKAQAVSAGRPFDVVLGADTVVVLEGEVLGKPKDQEDAKSMLRKLQGREHEVFTGVCVINAAGGFESSAHEETKVRFLPMSEEEIAGYVDTKEPLDKAGAYAIQGLGSLYIEGITGDYFNVVGLPLRLTARLLKEAGIRVI